MIRRALMGYIFWTLNRGSGSTENTSFIQCVGIREPHINELWCLGLENNSWEVHPTDRVEVISGTVGEFVTDYLAENVRIIQIIGQLSVNNSVQFLGFPDQGRGSGLPFVINMKALVEATGWDSYNN